jgi:hypothetical protein
VGLIGSSVVDRGLDRLECGISWVGSPRVW